MMLVSPLCPNDGTPLQAVALGADTAPWLCIVCSRGWWQSEVDASGLYNPRRADFGAATPTTAQRALSERSSAQARGTSARPDMLPLLTDDALARLAARADVAPNFGQQVRAEQARRKGAKP